MCVTFPVESEGWRPSSVLRIHASFAIESCKLVILKPTFRGQVRGLKGISIPRIRNLGAKAGES